MPERDGYEVAAFIKNDPQLAHIPVAAADRRVRAHRRGARKAVGCDGVLVEAVRAADRDQPRPRAAGRCRGRRLATRRPARSDVAQAATAPPSAAEIEAAPAGARRVLRSARRGVRRRCRVQVDHRRQSSSPFRPGPAARRHLNTHRESRSRPFAANCCADIERSVRRAPERRARAARIAAAARVRARLVRRRDRRDRRAGDRAPADHRHAASPHRRRRAERIVREEIDRIKRGHRA